MDSTFGALYVGVILATALYGVSCAQVFYYFQHYSEKDGRATKAVVVVTLASDTLHQVLICHVVYHYLVTNYNAPEQLGIIVWTLIGEVFPNAITAIIVQIFFALRIWRFSGKNLPLTATLAVFILGGFVASIVYAAQAMSFHTFAELGRLRHLSMTVNVLSVAADVMITVVFCVLLHRSRTSLRSSNTMINLLIIFTVQTGMLTSLCAIGSLISSAAFPNTFMFICFYFSMGRLYCNSLLATLNVRQSIREKGHYDLGISLGHIGGSSGVSSKDNRREIHIKTETMQFTTRDKSRGYDGSSIFAEPSTNNLRVVEGEYEPESGRGGRLKAPDPTKSRASSFTNPV